jgi:transposase
MLNISRSFDPTLDRVISLAGESTPHYCHIFYLPQTFPRLKINASRNWDSTFLLSHLMEQRAVVRFFTLKGMSPKYIHTELESVYMDEALCLCTVSKWHKRFMQGRTEPFDDPRSSRPLQNDRADALHAMIQEFPVTLCKRLCTDFRLAKSTCSRILHNVLCLKSSIYDALAFSRWRSQGRTGVTFHGPFDVLKEDEKNGFAQVITCDELWFYFDYLHQSV